LAAGTRTLHSRTGQLAPGHVADLVTWSAAHPGLQQRKGDALLDSWIFAGARALDGVWCAGRKVVSGGRHHARERIAARYAKTLTKMLS